jgi:hypothetical protein
LRANIPGGIHLKKLLLSLLAGIIIGGILASVFFDYHNSNYEIRNYYGQNSKIVKELDFNFISNAGAIMLGISICTFILWTYIERKRN